MTTKAEIGAWFDRGVEQNATHMLIVCDTYDWDDYPVYVFDNKEAHEKAASYPKNMQKLMEVYDLSMPKDEQLSAHRVFNVPKAA